MRLESIANASTDRSVTSSFRPTPQDLLQAFGLCLLVFAVSFVTYSRTLPPNADEMMNYALTESLAKLGRFDVDQVSTVGANPEEYGQGGHRYSKYGPAQAVLGVPLYWVAQALPIGAVDTVLLQNHVLTALTVGVLFLLARRLGYSSGVAFTLGLVYFFTTPAWVHAKPFFGEPTTTLLLLLTIYWATVGRLSDRRRDLVLTGVAASLLIASKYVNLIFIAPVPLFLMLPREDGWSVRSCLRRLLWIGAGALPVALLLGGYNWARFGSFLESGYARWEQFDTPLWEGVAGFLFSPGKSIFVYAPILLLLVAWLPCFWRRRPWLAGLLLVIFALHLGVYGTWWVWWGAWAWGPRFLVPLLPLAVLLLAEGLERAIEAQSKAWLTVAALLITLGLIIQALGVAVDHTVYMAHLLPLDPRPDTLTLYDVSRSPILAQLQFLNRRWLDFAWIQREGPSALHRLPFAASLLSVLVALPGLAVLWWRRVGRLNLATAAVTVLVLAGSTLLALNYYYRTDDPAMRDLTDRLAGTDSPAVVIHLAPDYLVPYLNTQKFPLYTVGWSEEPEPLNPRLLRLLEPVVVGQGYLWLVTQYPSGVPSNGVEVWLGRQAIKVEEVSAGNLRLARYRLGTDYPALIRVGARFDEGIELVGYELARVSAQVGDPLQITLVWRSWEPLHQDYTVFVHLVDSNGELRSQRDGEPDDGYRPTRSWEVGQMIPDHRAVPVPTGADLSDYELRVGLYLLATGERLSLLDRSGQSVGDSVALKLK